MKIFYILFTIVLSMSLYADDLCYQEETSDGFLLNVTKTLPIKNISGQELTDVNVHIDTTGFNFTIGSDCGIDPTKGGCSQESNIEMGPFGLLGSTIAYDLQTMVNNETDETWRKALFSFSMFSGTNLYATYVKDGLTRKVNLGLCTDETTTADPEPDPEYEQCGVFPSALNTWDTIYAENGDVVISADTIYADNIDGSVKCSETDEFQNVQQLETCTVDRLTIEPPTLPVNIDSFLTTTLEISGNLYEKEYPDLNIIGDTRFQATQLYNNSDRKYMSVHSILSTSSGATLTFTEGDYYFGAWNNNADLIVRTEGKVRFYIDGDMILNNNHLDFNYDEGNGLPENLYIFIGGNFNMTSSGGGSGYDMTAYVFAEGTFNAGTNTNNSSFTGAISSVGDMTLNNNQTYTYEDSGLSEDGFGECESTALAYVTGNFDAWDTSVADATPPALSDRIIKTKIVESPFQLSLASFNDGLSAYEVKSEPLSVSIYEKSTTMVISNTVTFNSAHDDYTFTVTEARRDAVVGFKMCASYFDATDDGVDNKIYALTSSSDCSGATQACDSVSENPTWRVCHSTDNFAIRPKNFSITSAASKIISAQNQAYSIQANNYLNLPTIGYNVSATDYAMDTSDTKYLPDDSIDATLMGTSTISDFSFNDGLSSDMNLSYSDIGKVGISMQDRTWAVVDITDTPQTCNADGAYVCGDTNATFIPKRFNLNNVHLNNSNSGTHTYISGDLNMSAQMSLIITAVNENNAITQNFTSASWEEPVSLDITIASAAITPTLIKNVIATNKLGFNAGALTLAMTETNSSKKLLFNYSRAKNIALNPFRIDGTEVTTSALASYASGETVTGSSVADQNATFVYGRTHAPRQRFTGPNGTALIYYEISCDETISVNACDRTLLPNGTNSKTSDDPRWFINPSHTVTNGVVGTVTQKGTSALVTATAPTGTNIANVALTYDFTSKGYQYKATMENNASSWLIYNPYDANDDDNDFEVEFTNSDSSWAGQKETDTVTNRNASDKTNRRSMW